MTRLETEAPMQREFIKRWITYGQLPNVRMDFIKREDWNKDWSQVKKKFGCKELPHAPEPFELSPDLSEYSSSGSEDSGTVTPVSRGSMARIDYVGGNWNWLTRGLSVSA